MPLRARALLVLAVLAALLATASPASAVAGFGDVKDDRYYTAPVQWMVDNEITTGTSPSCFSPWDAVTRAQAAAFLWRMEGEPAAAPHPFADVAKDWQQGPVSWMAANEITTGTSPTTFSPDDTLTRGQFAALLYRLAAPLTVGADHPFTDVVAPWQQDPVSWLFAEGITIGTSATEFSPNDPVTRGQIATFLHRYAGEPPVTVDPTGTGCGAADPGTGFESLFIGHSFFRPMALQMADLAPAAGFADHEQTVIFSGGASGAPLGLWNQPAKRAEIQGVLDSGTVELFGMTYHPTHPTLEGYTN
ncbi:MAG: S-layer homology domain-containing protein, partial [Actinomycetota bacterium]